jgi:hypothetical protein
MQAVDNNRRAELAVRLESGLVLAVVLVGVLFTWFYYQGLKKASEPVPRKASFTIKGLVEAEDLAILNRSPAGLVLLNQQTDGFPDGQWSKNTQVLAYQAKVGDWVEYGMPVVKSGQYLVSIYLTKAIDYGSVEISVNGKAIQNVDLFSETGKILATGRIELGKFLLSPENNRLKIKSIEHHSYNPSALDRFGIDGVVLEPQ